MRALIRAGWAGQAPWIIAKTHLDTGEPLEGPSFAFVWLPVMRSKAIFLTILGVILAFTSPSEAVHAQNKKAPYWASTQYEGVRMRVGPDEQYPIKWVYRDRGLPLKVIRLLNGWRLVEDPDGETGWISGSQLKLDRTAMVVGEGLVILRETPASDAKIRWRAEPGVIGQLLRCRESWCEIDVSGRSGWVEAERLWGAGEPASSEK